MPVLVRRLIGGALLLLSFTPLYRTIAADDDALRQASADVAATTLDLAVTGSLVVVLVGLLLGYLVPRQRVLPLIERISLRVAGVGLGRWAAGVSILAFCLALFVNAIAYHGLYTNVDEISSIIHARYLAAGQLAGPLPGSPAGWLIPNMLTVDAGWVSQFPPSHLALLALGVVLGVPMLLGPLLFGALAGLTTLSLPRLVPEHGNTARISGLLIAVSPFLVSRGAGGWSHVSAGAFLVLTLYAALRARDEGWRWSVLAGVAIGVAVCSRPWISVLLGTLATLGTWLPAVREQLRATTGTPGDGPSPWRWLAARAGGTIAGGAPFALALAWYNRALFGSATTLGYLAAFGDRHRLGFHQDPWGNVYTPADALGFTSSDIIVFGTELLETPVPLGAVIGLWLLATRRLPRGARFLVAWALVPVAANAIYWFHSTRMLYEAAPAWLALVVLALAPLFSAPSGESPPPRRLDVPSVGLWSTVVAAGMAIALGLPQRAGSFSWDSDTLARITVPTTPGPEAALVFVHSSWNERLSARLQGDAGMRQDSVISVLRRNTNCSLDEYARIRETSVSGAVPLPQIDLRQIPGTPDDIVRPAVPDGTTLRTRQGERFSPECQRELNADRFGAVALGPLLWQGDLPGIERGAPLFVRDLGPERNDALRAHYADRSAWVFVPKQPGAPPELVPYEEAMQVLWGN